MRAPTKKQTFITLASLLLLATITYYLAHSREPLYNGKPFTRWLVEYSQHSSAPSQEQQQAMKALGEMGTNAVPIIVRTLERSDSPIRNKYREVWAKFPAFLKRILPEPAPENFYMSNAARMFRQLVGTNIVGQLPELLRSSNPAVREAASLILIEFRAEPYLLSNEQILSLCIPRLNDSSPRVRGNAAFALMRIGTAASNAVPGLILTLQGSEVGRKKGDIVHPRATAAMALGSIGPAAASAVPALTNLLASTSDAELRVKVASAIWHITSNENVALPVLISDCPALDPPVKWSALIPLEEMGPRAKSAIPMLLNELSKARSDTDNIKHGLDTLGMITNALKAIDLEAAAKAGVK